MINLHDIFIKFCHEQYFLALHHCKDNAGQYLETLFLKYLAVEYDVHKDTLDNDKELRYKVLTVAKYLTTSVTALSKLEINTLFPVKIITEHPPGFIHPYSREKLTSFVETVHPGLKLPEFNDLTGKKRYLKRMSKLIEKEPLPFKVKLLMEEL